MTKHFRKEIITLNKKVMHLTTMVEENLRLAVKAVTDRDTDLAKEVIKRDFEIDQNEVELEEECLKILALHQPVAIDLRFIIAALKINSDLERIGDLAVNIAELTPELANSSLHEVPFDLNGMLDLAVEMVRESVDALVDMSPEKAFLICQKDDIMDSMYHKANKSAIDMIRKNSEHAAYFMGLRNIARHLERIADHATNIAEDVIYMVNGEIVRHQGENMNK
ncbi:MAG: phosphate signaling complex protein PhoU [candidate division Zixibacteria bacterium]|nr:phosphate signaling complex protein PhoU [candidate division Zixibacteria bacterium]